MTALQHTVRTLEFIAFAPMPRVAPLSGAAREQDWEPVWKPVFVWPDTPSDKARMVFTVSHGHKNSVWVNAQYDLAGGHLQYV